MSPDITDHICLKAIFQQIKDREQARSQAMEGQMLRHLRHNPAADDMHQHSVEGRCRCASLTRFAAADWM